MDGYSIYEENGKIKIERRIYPCFIAEIKKNELYSDIIDVEWIGERPQADADYLARIMREAGEAYSQWLLEQN